MSKEGWKKAGLNHRLRGKEKTKFAAAPKRRSTKKA